MACAGTTGSRTCVQHILKTEAVQATEKTRRHTPGCRKHQDNFNIADLTTSSSALQQKYPCLNSLLSRCEVLTDQAPTRDPKQFATSIRPSIYTPLSPPTLWRSNSTITRNRSSINRRSNSFRYSDCVPDRGLFKTGHLKLKLSFAITINRTRVSNAEQLGFPMCSGCEQGRLFEQGVQKVGICIRATFRFTTAVAIKITALWHVTLRSLVDTYRHFGGTYCSYLQGWCEKTLLPKRQ